MSKRFLISEEERSYIVSLYGDKSIILNEQKQFKIGDYTIRGGNTNPYGSTRMSIERKTYTGKEKEFSSSSNWIKDFNTYLKNPKHPNSANQLKKLIELMARTIKRNMSKVEPFLDKKGDTLTNWRELVSLVQQENFPTKNADEMASKILDGSIKVIATPLVSTICSQVSFNKDLKRLINPSGPCNLKYPVQYLLIYCFPPFSYICFEILLCSHRKLPFRYDAFFIEFNLYKPNPLKIGRAHV